MRAKNSSNEPFSSSPDCGLPKEEEAKKDRGEMSRGPFKRRVCLGKGETTATKESKQTLAEGLGWYWGARDGCGVLVQRHWDLYLQI